MNMNKFFLAAFALLLAVLPSCGSLGKIVRGGASGVKSGYDWVTSSTPADKKLESSEKDNKKPVVAAEKEAKAASDEVTMMTKKEGENSPEAVEARNKLAIAKIGVTQAKVDFLRKQALLAKTAEETLSQTVKDTSGDEKSTAITQWNKVNSKIESYDKQLIEAAKEYGKTLNTLPAGFTGRTEIVVDEDSEKLGHNDPRLEPFVNPAKAQEMAKDAEAEAAAKKGTPAAPKTVPAKPVEATEKQSEEPANPPTAGVTPTAAPTKVPAIAVATPTLAVNARFSTRRQPREMT